MIFVTPKIQLHEDELHFQFIHASGPGGQNVNKVASAAQLRFDLAHSPSLTETVRKRAMKLAGQWLTKDGEVVITAKRYRTQQQNRDDAVERLKDLLRRASVIPKPRKKTRPSKGAKRRRLEAKKKHKQKKQRRRSPRLSDY